MPLIAHLEELRRRLGWIVGATAAAGIPGWFAFDRVVDTLLAPARPYLKDLSRGDLIFTGPLEAFGLRFKIAMYVGFAIASPVILLNLWRFISPGLYKRERRYAVPFVGASVLLFLAGVMFAYQTLPQALRFLIGPEITGSNVSPLLGAKPYLDFALLYHAIFGVAFEFPVVLMGFAFMRVISSRQMAAHRRHVFLGIAIASAVLTPSADWLTMLALTAAMYAFFESSIWLARLFHR